MKYDIIKHFTAFGSILYVFKQKWGKTAISCDKSLNLFNKSLINLFKSFSAVHIINIFSYTYYQKVDQNSVGLHNSYRYFRSHSPGKRTDASLL